MADLKAWKLDLDSLSASNKHLDPPGYDHTLGKEVVSVRCLSVQGVQQREKRAQTCSPRHMDLQTVSTASQRKKDTGILARKQAASVWHNAYCTKSFIHVSV